MLCAFVAQNSDQIGISRHSENYLWQIRKYPKTAKL